MAEVYWIRLPEHTDMFTQGYIGVTRNTAGSRFRGHVQHSKMEKGWNYRISRVIRKYGRDNLIVQTLVKCDEDYAYGLELLLRPSEHMGWNVAVGGKKSGNYGGYKLSDETRKKMSDSFANGTRQPISEETKRKMSEAQIGKPRGPLTESSVAKRERTRFLKLWEDNPDIWAKSDIWFEYYAQGLGLARKCERHYGLQLYSLVINFNRFRTGWIPNEDQDWLIRFKEGQNVS